jgi:hypothetical protein
MLAELLSHWWVLAFFAFLWVIGRMAAEKALMDLDRTELQKAIDKLESTLKDEGVAPGDWIPVKGGEYYIAEPPKRKRLTLGDDGEVLDMEDEKPKRKELHI